MGSTLFDNARLIDPEGSEPLPGRLLVRDGRIQASLTHSDAAPDDARVIDLGGRWLAPGFLDLHVHGSTIFAPIDSLDDALRRDAASCLRHGVTAFLPTTVAWPVTHLGEFVTRCASSLGELPAGCAQPLGLHLEGPWINPGAAGAQPPGGIRPFEPARGAEVFDRAAGAVRLVTYAPELPGAGALQAELDRRGIVGALGHSLADAETASSAADRGARHVTHLFNAMGSLHHRSPGLAVAAMSDDRLTCDLICDGAHVHPRMVALATRAVADRLVLITDRVDPPADGGISALGSGGSLRDDGEAWRLPDGRLAGSRVTLDAAVRNLVAFTGAGLCEAVAACSFRPARVLGLERERGSLRPGARADLAILDDALRVRETWLAGRCVYSA